MFDLSDRVALVTGAGQGVGEGIARALHSQGAAVAVNDIHRERAEAVAADLGDRAAGVAFDVRDMDGITAGFREVTASLGPVDILVNNAGVPEGMGMAPFTDTGPEDWEPYVAVNLYGTMQCCAAALPSMLDAGHGRIVCISSEASRTGMPIGIAAYSAAKGGINGFMRALATEVAARGVTVNALALGLIDAPSMPDGFADTMKKAHPVGRIGQPADVAAAVVWLASREAEWVTGQTIGVNGGAYMSQ